MPHAVLPQQETDAFDRLRVIVRNEVEKIGFNVGTAYGNDWHFLSEAEAEVFDLTLDDMPSLVAIWCAYEEIAGVCDMLDLPAELVAELRASMPWIKPRVTDALEFSQFAGFFGISKRKADAWFWRLFFFQARSGIVFYDDEPKD